MKTKLPLSFFILTPAFIFCSFNFGPSVDFSGTWVIDMNKSSFDNHPQDWAYKAMSVKQGKDAITIENAIEPANGKDSTSSETLAFIGAVSRTVLPNTAHGIDTRERHVSCSQDGKMLTITETHELDKRDHVAMITVVDTWILAADNRELVVSRNFEFADMTATIKAVYNRK